MRNRPRERQAVRSLEPDFGRLQPFIAYDALHAQQKQLDPFGKDALDLDFGQRLLRKRDISPLFERKLCDRLFQFFALLAGENSSKVVRCVVEKRTRASCRYRCWSVPVTGFGSGTVRANGTGVKGGLVGDGNASTSRASKAVLAFPLFF